MGIEYLEPHFHHSTNLIFRTVILLAAAALLISACNKPKAAENTKAQVAPPQPRTNGALLGIPKLRKETDEAEAYILVRKNSGSLNYCYDKQLKAFPNLHGILEIGFKIRGGKVAETHIGSNTTGNEELGICVLRMSARWSVSPGLNGDFTFPISFTSDVRKKQPIPIAPNFPYFETPRGRVADGP